MMIAISEVVIAMQGAGLIERWALAGAQAAVVWDEAITTHDVDIAIIVPGRGLDLMGPIFAWLQAQGYAFDHEQVIIAGVPVQFLPAWSPLVEAAILDAIPVPLGDRVEIPVIGPEYLAAIWLTPPADTRVRRERAMRLIDLPTFDHDKYHVIRTLADRTWARTRTAHAYRRSLPPLVKMTAALRGGGPLARMSTVELVRLAAVDAPIAALAAEELRARGAQIVHTGEGDHDETE